MNTPKALWLSCLDKTELAFNSLCVRSSDTVKLREAEQIQKQLLDAANAMGALIRQIRGVKEPVSGEVASETTQPISVEEK